MVPHQRLPPELAVRVIERVKYRWQRQKMWLAYLRIEHSEMSLIAVFAAIIVAGSAYGYFFRMPVGAPERMTGEITGCSYFASPFGVTTFASCKLKLSNGQIMVYHLLHAYAAGTILPVERYESRSKSHPIYRLHARPCSDGACSNRDEPA